MSVADQSRILMLELLMHDNDTGKARRIAADEAHFRSLGSAWCAHMVAVAEHVVPAIDIIEAEIHSTDRRHRQNISTLLGAGFVALHGRVPTADEAKSLADEFRPTVEHHAAEIERDDALECLDFLMAHVVSDFSLGHWVALERDRIAGRMNGHEDARRFVAMHDIIVRVEGDQPGMLIRNTSPVIEQVFRDTQWAGGAWKRALRKLPGAFSLKDPVQFPGSATKARCIGLPLFHIPPALLDDRRSAI